MIDMTDAPQPERPKTSQSDPEFMGAWWTHPYVLYIFFTLILFGGLVLAGYLALKNGWLPNQH
jgi:hypothetical protein